MKVVYYTERGMHNRSTLHVLIKRCAASLHGGDAMSRAARNLKARMVRHCKAMGIPLR